MSIDMVRTSSVDILMARSWFLVPAVDSETLTAAAQSGTDCLVVDLEDGLPSAAKGDGRACVAGWLDGQRGWVRLNDATTDHWQRDLESIQGSKGLHGVMLSKTDSPEQVRATAAALPGVPVVALIESAAAVVAADEIARTAPVVRLAFGIGDYCRDIGAGRSPMALAYARSRLVNASRAAGIGAPVDGPTLVLDAEVTRSDARLALDMGMTGKLTLSSEQVPVINSALAPDADEVVWAETIIDRLGADGSRATHGGHRPQLARAHDILRRSAHFTGRRVLR
ncbi:HpcH/HpaI aldolase/citrate lyase family protein [Rhodococcus sp. WAY2]|uniref:HpcH/HpaI aldolase/citrate lyase family protein n=1 Tax=Rhodococcus sp. WAY2 TaxID=2663121 RepID=UPI00131F7BDE|nr:CoA ester lyase [Rhodococcus sp. WAY2]QHE69369.1 Citrate lyase beta chain [Rhodococcus sp. WAY2]